MPRLTRPLLLWSATLAGVAALRFPYLASPTYILDGDEAVLGVMARRMAAGSEWPLYFAGQNYGLAIFETLPAALAFRVFGESPLVLALAVLAVFLAGLVPYARALERISGSREWGIILVVVLALLPGWVVWSLKARGLYVSGFALTGCALALLTRPALGRWGLLGVGALFGLIGLVQPLWLLVTLPVLTLRRRPMLDVLVAGGVAGVIWLGSIALGPTGEAFWQPRLLGGFLPAQLQVLPRALMNAFTGRVPPHDPGAFASLAGILAVLAFFLLLAMMGADALRRRSEWALPVGVAMVASVLHIVVLAVWVPRYFLPSTVLAVVAAAAWLGARRIAPRGGPLVTSGLVIGLLTLAATRLGQVGPGSPLGEISAQEDLAALIAALQSDGVRGVYAFPAHLQWQIIFYGNERMPTRGRSNTDRYPEFPHAVGAARMAREPLAFVADIRDLRNEVRPIEAFPGYRVGERYLRLDEPTPLLLVGLGFEPDLTEP